MKVFIQYKNYPATKLEFLENTSYSNLKKTIAKTLNLHSQNFRITHRGTELSKTLCLQNMGIQKSTILKIDEFQEYNLPPLITQELDISFQKIMANYQRIVNDIQQYFKDRMDLEMKRDIIQLSKLSEQFISHVQELKLRLISDSTIKQSIIKTTNRSRLNQFNQTNGYKQQTLEPKRIEFKTLPQ